MKRRTLSIISDIIVILIGFFFLLSSITTLSLSGSFYRSAAFYPILISSCTIIIAVFALYKDVFIQDKGKKETMELGNMKNFVFLACLLVVMQIIWQYLGFFYASILLGTCVIIYIFHNTGKTKRERLIFTSIIGPAITLLFYIIFTFLLKIEF